MILDGLHSYLVVHGSHRKTIDLLNNGVGRDLIFILLLVFLSGVPRAISIVVSFLGVLLLVEGE